jgi:hypothetical protein
MRQALRLLVLAVRLRSISCARWALEYEQNERGSSE